MSLAMDILNTQSNERLSLCNTSWKKNANELRLDNSNGLWKTIRSTVLKSTLINLKFRTVAISTWKLFHLCGVGHFYYHRVLQRGFQVSSIPSPILVCFLLWLLVYLWESDFRLVWLTALSTRLKWLEMIGSARCHFSGLFQLPTRGCCCWTTWWWLFPGVIAFSSEGVWENVPLGSL